MRECRKCGVTVRGEQELCPLCQAKLPDSGADRSQYPFIPQIKSKLRFFLKLGAFATAAVVIACAVVNLLVPTDHNWWLLVLFGAVCFWISFYSAVRKRHNLPKNIVMQVAEASVICVLWDLFTGFNGWSLDYVIPGVCAGAMVALTVLGIVLKLPASDYIFCLLSDVVFGILPVVFWLTGLLNVYIPSAVCVGLSVLIIVGILLFRWHETKLESQKRFHM